MNEESFSNDKKAEEVIRVLFNSDFELNSFCDDVKNERIMAELIHNTNFSDMYSSRALFSSKK